MVADLLIDTARTVRRCIREGGEAEDFGGDHLILGEQTGG